MAEPTTSDHDRVAEPCVMHHSNVGVSGNCKKSLPRFGILVKYVDIWKDHPQTENATKFFHFKNCDLQSASIPVLPVSTNCGFHQKWYQRFTDATRIEKVKNAKRTFHEFF